MKKPIFESYQPRVAGNFDDGDIRANSGVRTGQDNLLFQKGNKRSLVGSWELQVTIRDGQTGDPGLVELAQSMGGTPMEIIEDRECWAEAMRCSISATG